MKYLIDHRFKKLHTICMHVASILSSYKRGRSFNLSPSLRALQEEIEDLDSFKSPPFTKEQVAQVEALEIHARHLLLLPDNLEEIGSQLLKQTEQLLIQIDPFTYTLEESADVRRSRIVELTTEIQLYIQNYLLELEGNATSIIDEKLIIQDIMNDIKRIETKELNEGEVDILQQLFVQNVLFQKCPTLEETSCFAKLAKDVEHLFREKRPLYTTLTEMIEFLLSVFQKSNALMTSEESDFAKFTAPLRSFAVATALMRLEKIVLHTKPLISSRENILFAYENGLLEEGNTFISRCRAIDFYKLFGYELSDFAKALQNTPEKDVKLI